MSKTVKLSLFLFIFLIFCYFRLKPLYFQTVGYTYDQGRDFIEASKIVLEKDITFIGPTTGIAGLFHGAWWYYILTIPFLIFGGLPIGFYYFNFVIQTASFFFLAFFLYKNFGTLSALIISLIVATSPYFVFTSIFVGNNIMVLPFFLAFLICNYYILQKQNDKKFARLAFFVGILLGFIAEFEVAFGLFLIPSYVLLILLINSLRRVFTKKKNVLLFVGGLFIPFIPRLLFEVKNSFMQTNVLINSFLHPQVQNANSFAGAFQDRTELFFGYFRSLFNYELILVVFIFTLIISFTIVLQNKFKKIDETLVFFLSLLGLLFFFAGLNKDSFFWGNYYEGIQYLYLIILAITLSTKIKNQLFLNFIQICIFAIFLILTIFDIKPNLLKEPKNSGNLKTQMQIVDYVQDRESKHESYCVKIYTPPAIPYTYNYLFLYNELSKKINPPEKDWTDNKCWLIIESDDFKERQAKWIDDNLPRSAKLNSSIKINDTEVRLYERN